MMGLKIEDGRIPADLRTGTEQGVACIVQRCTRTNGGDVTEDGPF